jgi:LCP family protein required for cell wall assembly
MAEPRRPHVEHPDRGRLTASGGGGAGAMHERIARLAAPLSFLLPGLGQAALGRRRRGALLAIPALATGAAVVVLAAVIAGDPTAALDLLPGPEAIAALLVLQGAILVYHLAAILDAERLGQAARPSRGAMRVVSAVVLVALLGGAVTIHGAVGYVEVEAGSALAAVFGPGGGAGVDDDDDGWAIPEPSFEPDPTSVPTPAPTASATLVPTPDGIPGATASIGPATTPTLSPTPLRTADLTPEPTRSPRPTAAPVSGADWAQDGRLNLLLIGSDAGPDRWSLRTDTMIVLSVVARTGRAALFGIPRNLVGVPLPPESAGATKDGRFHGLLNALYVYAMAHPRQFPGGEARGMRAVSGAVQELVGVRLDGLVVVNLGGFTRLVDELGGLWIDVPYRLRDRNYPLEDGSGWMELDIRAGCQHLDGRMALAYARSRHQDSDYGRMNRQQLVLLSLRNQLDPLRFVSRAPALLRIAGDSLWTTIRRKEIRGLARLADRVDSRRVERVLFVPPAYSSRLDDREIARIRRVVRTVFDGPRPPADPALAPGSCP